MDIKVITGGICAPKGYKAAGMHAGIRYSSEKKDLMMITSETTADAAGVYTTNKVKGAPITVTKENIADGKASLVICNSGNANTCAPNGEEIAWQICELAAAATGKKAEDVIVASTGVIGEPMAIEPFEKNIPALAEALNADGSDDAAAAIMTTDTVKKEIAIEFEIGGKTCRIGCIAKGSGMIHPNMATMLCFITSDVAISAEMLREVLKEDVKDSFNQMTVDGDTSTNDMCMVMANGMAGNEKIEGEGEDLEAFKEALAYVTRYTAMKLASDGEGAGKLIVCDLKGAPDKDTARKVSRSVVSSSLLKAAIFGEDANWGRVLCAIGYTDADFSADKVDVVMRSDKGSVTVCLDSRYAPHSEEEAALILSADKIYIDVDLKDGEASATAWGCDLTYDYVKINGDYRS